MKRPPSVCRKCNGLMQQRLPISDARGDRYFGDNKPFLRMGNLEIHRYVCLKCGHCEIFHFDSKSFLRRPPK